MHSKKAAKTSFKRSDLLNPNKRTASELNSSLAVQFFRLLAQTLEIYWITDKKTLYY